jgi:YidC/Oxa1 family membrane protein insertase
MIFPLLATAATKVVAATTTNTIPLGAQTTDHSIFNPIAKPIADVLAAFYSVVPNYGVAIILLSIAWMIIIAPLTLKSTRSMLAMQKLQPELAKLKAEHKNDRQAFAAAQMELFKQHSVSPFGSCLPTLLPLPVFFALFRVIDGLSHHVKVNGVLYADPNFLSHHTRMYTAIVKANGHINAFGLDLSKNALSGHSSFGAAVPFYILLLIMIGTQYLQTAQMMARNPAANDNPQMKMMKYLPIFFGVICVRFPAGVILYYAMSNICRMAQQTAMYRYDPKVRTLAAREVQEVEAMTRDIDRRSGGANGTKAVKKAADTPPARNSRFRDALAQATKQATDGRAKKPGDTGTTGAKPKPGTTPPRPATAKTRNTNGSGARPAPANGSQPAKARPRNAAAGAKPAAGTKPAAGAKPAASSKPAAGSNPATAAKPPSGSRGARPANGQNGGGAATPTGNGSTAARPAADPRTPAKSTTPANGNNGAAVTGNGSDQPGSSPANGAGSMAPSNGNGNGNGNGADPAPTAASNGSKGAPAGGQKPPGATGGRTGASQPRTPPRKRRGR